MKSVTLLPLSETLHAAPENGVDLYWIGQAGFIARSGTSFAVIDPYLSNHLEDISTDDFFKHRRLMPPPVAPDEIRGASHLLITHDHLDHLDPESAPGVMRASPSCVLLCPGSMKNTVAELGIPASRTIFPGERSPTRTGDMTVTMIPAAHEELERDAAGDLVSAGFVFTLGGVTLYHSGDCVPYPGLTELLSGMGIDVALLPVNGRDEFRQSHGIVGNFSVEEAAGLCHDAGIPWLIPHHFGMFDFNTVEPAEIASRLSVCAGNSVHWLLPRIVEGIAIR